MVEVFSANRSADNERGAPGYLLVTRMPEAAGDDSV
jgi:hypothetical protein